MRKARNERPENGTPRTGHVLLWIIVIEVLVVVAGFIIVLLPREDEDVDALLEQEVTIEYTTEPETEALAVPRPDIDEQLLTVNEFSRPGTKTDGIKYIVIHYLGNPKTTAQENRDYFESLKNDLDSVYMSANYVVGLEGEIIQCVPDDEIAYASNDENHESISIENCHPDETGMFTEATYNSLVKLTAYLTEKYGLGRDEIIRHYDVTGKECPVYYVENEDKWEEFKDDVMAYREECEAAMAATEETEETEETQVDELAAYLEELSETEEASGEE